jgi:glycosyltransferase involved in cell wall biosynthesis
MNPILSIVIPSKNEGFNLIQVLNLLRGQTDCQVIVADSSDDNDSLTLLKSYDLPNIKIVNGGLPSVARNKGASLVETPYVLFIDADTYIYEKDLINNCLKTAIQGDYDLVTCKFKTDKPYRWVYKAFTVIQMFTSFTKPFALGVFMLFKTETFKKLGGFNEEDKIAEDYHLSSKIRPSKFKVQNNYVYTPSRRFCKKGVWYMIKLMLRCWINRNNNDFYKKDYNYWS